MTSGIIEILIEDPNVQAVIGQDTSGHYKIYPTRAPERVEVTGAPYIIVQEASLTPSLGKMCPSTLDNIRYEVLVYSTDFLQTEIIQEAVRVCLDNGQQWDTSLLHFDGIWMVDRRDAWSPGVGQDGGMYVKVGTYEASAKRTIT